MEARQLTSVLSARNLGLDLLRLIAVLLVLGRHLKIPAEGNLLLKCWQRGGWVGVDVFFVLSGFLISGLLFKEHLRFGKIQIGRFLIRRAFKLYPAFWFFIVCSVVIRLALNEPIPTKRLVGELLFLQNYLGGLWNHTWSLAVEEHFYLGIALLFGVMLSASRKDHFYFVPGAFAVVAATCLGLRIWNDLSSFHFSYFTYMYTTHIRIDSLFAGVFLSYLAHYKGFMTRIHSIPSAALIVVGCILLAPPFLYEVEKYTWVTVYGFIPLYVGSGCLVIAFVRIQASHSIILGILGALGTTSYSIYLWHIPVNHWGTNIAARMTGRDSFAQYMIVYVVGALFFGWLTSKCVEWPMLRVRDRLFFPRAAGV